MSILTLPRELQLHILGLLPVPELMRLSETCHRLKDLSRDPSLWKELTLTYNMIKNNTKACRDHVGRCSSLRELFITGQERNIRNDTTISVVLKAKRTLKNLECSLPLGSSYFTKISMMTQLNKLDLNCASIRSDGITALSNLKDLRSLKIFNLCSYYKDLVALFSSLKNLEEVQIRRCPISNVDVVIESLVVNNPNLHHLDINQDQDSLVYANAHYSYHDCLVTRLTSRGLTSIADNCPLLTYIDIGNQYSFTNDDLINLVSKCSKLRYVNLENTWTKDSTLERLANDCPNLEHLNLFDCRAVTVQGVEAFLNKSAQAKLKFLDVGYCTFLTDDYLEPIESVKEILHKFEQENPHISIHYDHF